MNTEADTIDRDNALASFLQQEAEQAKDTRLDERRKLCMERYRGEPFGDEELGRSSHKTRDVKHQVDHMLVSILEAVISGEKVVEFESENTADDEALKLATRVIHEQFFRRENGFQVVRDAAKGGLIEVLGHVLVYHERDERIDRAILQSEEEVAVAEENGLEVEEFNDDVVAVKRTEKTRFCVKYLPGNEVLVARDARDIQTSVYAANVYETTISGLRKQGYDIPDTVSDGYDSRAGREHARDSNSHFDRSYRSGPQRTVTVYHEFVRYDYDGDGISELRQVMRVGSHIFLNKEVAFGLIEEWCPFPIPGRRVGESLAEVALETERARTTLLREILDNYGFSNRPRLVVGEGARTQNGETMDDLNNFATGAPIRARDASQIQAITIPFTGRDAFTGMEFLAREMEKNTGVTQVNQGLSTESLHDTASGARMQAELGQQIELYIAREFAEFLGRVFTIMYRLMRDHGEPIEVMVSGNPQTVDPRTWPEVFTVTPRTGLGSGKRQTRAEARMVILDVQRQGIEAGYPIKGEHLFHNIDGLVQDLGLGEGRNYWPAPDSEEQEQPRKSPEDMKAEAEQAKVQAKIETDNAISQQAMANRQAEFDQGQQLADLKQQSEIERANAKAAFEAQLARDKANFEAELAREQAEFEAGMARDRAELDGELAVKQAAHGANIKSYEAEQKNTLPKNRPGGSLSE